MAIFLNWIASYRSSFIPKWKMTLHLLRTIRLQVLGVTELRWKVVKVLSESRIFMYLRKI